MRTITGAASFTISAPDAFTYIFSPNVLTVTLASNVWDANQIVIIVGNGLTFTRRAIGHVARFDLMPIFESKFPDTDFDLYPASGFGDRFFADDFNIAVSVGGNVTNVPFRLRWGALQHDEVMSYASIKFPFWVGKPLAINNSVDHAFWQHNIDGGASGTGVITLRADSTAQFIYLVGLGQLSQSTTYYPVTCSSTNGHYLQWIDQRGRIWQYMFTPNRVNGTATEVNSSGGLKRYPVDFTDSTKGRDLPARKDKQRTFQCFASVDIDIFPIVASVVASPIVRLWAQNRWVRVTIAPQTITPDVGWMSDIEFTVELPRDYVQRL